MDGESSFALSNLTLPSTIHLPDSTSFLPTQLSTSDLRRLALISRLSPLLGDMAVVALGARFAAVITVHGGRATMNLADISD